MKEHIKGITNKFGGILMTALAGAGIAFLQSVITQTTGGNCEVINPVTASVASAGLRTAWVALNSVSSIM